jgi:hypothetical protein
MWHDLSITGEQDLLGEKESAAGTQMTEIKTTDPSDLR